MSDVVLPCAIDAEQSVLGGLLLAPEKLSLIADWLALEDFMRLDHREIYRGICEMAQRGQPCDAVTMADWFEAQGLTDVLGGPVYVLQLANNTPGSANIVAYAEIIREKAQLRRAIDTAERLQQAALQRGAESEAVIAAASHELSALSSSSGRTGLQPTKPLIRSLTAEIQRRYTERDRGLVGLATPWKDLNDRTKGLRDGVLYVVGGRPSMGKSIWGFQLAGFNALRGEHVAVFSVEMTGDESMGRLFACHGEIPHAWVDAPDDSDDSEIYWSRLTAISESYLAAPLLIDDTPGIRIEQLMARARREHLRRPLRLIVIDHLHDMGVDRTKELRHELGHIAQGAKTLAKEMRCPVVLLAQLSRAAAGRADKRPTLVDLRESGEIEQKADVVLFLHREDYYDAETHMVGAVELSVAKGRNLAKGDRPILLQNRFDQMRMDDWFGAYPLPPPVEPRAKPQRSGRRAFNE